MAYIKCPGCNRDVDQNKYEDMLKKEINKKDRTHQSKERKYVFYQ